jgi:hypothetical protein
MAKHDLKIFILVLSGFILSPVKTFSQNYLVTYNSFSTTLYKGCVQQMEVDIISGKDYHSPTGYIFHAQITGAGVDYDSTGRITILPHRDGAIKVFLEKGNIFYRVKGSIAFNLVTPPAPNMDAVFDKNMGNPPKNKLEQQKQFVLPLNAKVEDSEFEIKGNWLSHLSSKRPTEIRLDVLWKENGKYAPQFGEIAIRSEDARIEKKESNKFLITPLPQKSKCTLSVFLNGKKIDVKVFSVF